MMKYEKITAKQFTKLFRVKEFKGKWDCYGTWNGLDMYCLADTPENARIEMWNKLMKAGWAFTHREEVLMQYASQCYWAKNDIELQRISKLI